jgi:hypothetical protein
MNNPHLNNNGKLLLTLSFLFKSLPLLENLSMKEGSLFCFVLFCFVGMRSTKWDASDRVHGVFGKLSMRRGA